MTDNLKSRSEIKRVLTLAPDKVIAEIEGLRQQLAEQRSINKSLTGQRARLEAKLAEAEKALEYYERECSHSPCDCLQAREALARIKGEDRT